MQSQGQPVTAIAYPLDHSLQSSSMGPPPPNMSGNNNSNNQDALDISAILTSSQESIDMGENFFSQLDSMIAAVKVESHALFSVKEKLQEMDSLRDQLVAVNKRMVELEQSNLNLKQVLIQEQQNISELRKQKTEADSQAIALRQEVNRYKEALSKERNSKNQLGAEITQLREQIAKLEKNNENLDRDAKALPGLLESNEILKNDLTSLRNRYKDEMQHYVNQIKLLQGQAADGDMLRKEMRTLGMRLVEVASNSQMQNSQLLQGYNASNGKFPPGFSMSPQRAMSNMTMNPHAVSYDSSQVAGGESHSGFESENDDLDDGYDDDNGTVGTHESHRTAISYHDGSYQEIEENLEGRSALAGGHVHKVRQQIVRQHVPYNQGQQQQPVSQFYVNSNQQGSIKAGQKAKPRKRRSLQHAPQLYENGVQSGNVVRLTSNLSLPKI